MSTSAHGLAAEVEDAAKATQLMLGERVAELQQLELEDPLTGEEMLVAREQMGFGAGALAVQARARENRRGRPPGSKNKATVELRSFLMQFGPDPLVAAQRVSQMDPLVGAELFKCKPIEFLDRQLRSREMVAPYMHGKKPVAVDISFSGVADLMITGVTHTAEEVAAIEAQWSPVGEDADGEGGAA